MLKPWRQIQPHAKKIVVTCYVIQDVPICVEVVQDVLLALVIVKVHALGVKVNALVALDVPSTAMGRHIKAVFFIHSITIKL